MNLIYDKLEVERFFNRIFPNEWDKNEVAFVSLAARKKYIKNNEDIDLGHRPAMLDKDVIKKRDFDYYLSRLRRFEADGAYIGNNGEILPEDIMAIYVNIHLSDTAKAWMKTKEEMSSIETEIMSHVVHNQLNLDHAFNSMKNLSNIWYSQIQNNYSKKRWIDIDVDLEEPDKLIGPEEERLPIRKILGNLIRSNFEFLGVNNFFFIQTRGGFHILVSTVDNKFNSEINPNSLVLAVKDYCKSFSKEVVLNKNGMVPCPGTIQGGFEVYMEG